jgi:hypothetical protein
MGIAERAEYEKEQREQAGDVIFNVQGGAVEMLRLCGDGRILVKGQECQADQQVVDAFKAFLKAAEEDRQGRCRYCGYAPAEGHGAACNRTLEEQIIVNADLVEKNRALRKKAQSLEDIISFTAGTMMGMAMAYEKGELPTRGDELYQRVTEVRDILKRAFDNITRDRTA